MQDTPTPQKIVLDRASAVELRKAVERFRADGVIIAPVHIDLFEALIDHLEASLSL